VTLCVLPLVQYQDQDSDPLGLVIVAVLVITARLIKKLTVSPTYVVLIVCKMKISVLGYILLRVLELRKYKYSYKLNLR